MRIPWRAREYERTCGDCGYVWLVPRWAVHPPMKGLPIAGVAGATRYEVNAVVTANADLAEEASAFRVCPKCGSVHYTQRRVWS
jgi:ribosomal protein S27AE